MSQLRTQRDVVSQVGILGAMRARDVSRPDDEDLALAEAKVVVSYRPPRSTSGGHGQESSARGGNSTEDS